MIDSAKSGKGGMDELKKKENEAIDRCREKYI